MRFGGPGDWPPFPCARKKRGVAPVARDYPSNHEMVLVSDPFQQAGSNVHLVFRALLDEARTRPATSCVMAKAG